MNPPPRGEVLPKLAAALGVSVDTVLGVTPQSRTKGPVGKVRQLFEDVSKLPRRQQDKIVEFMTPIVEQFKKAG